MEGKETGLSKNTYEKSPVSGKLEGSFHEEAGGERNDKSKKPVFKIS